MPELNPSGDPQIGGIKIGTGSNLSKMEADGTLVFEGNSTVWDDLVGSLIARRLESTTGRLQYNFSESAIIMQNNGSISNNADRLMFNYQYPHAAIVDGEMRVHIHWEQTTTNDIEFTCQYRIQKNGQPKNTTWTTVVVGSNANNVFTYTSGTLNQITNIVDVDMTDAGISSTVQFRLARTDSTTGDINAVFVDAHVERDMVGSRQPFTK